MLCYNCIAKNGDGCFLKKGKFVRCNRTEEEIKQAKRILNLSYKLDEVALRYNNVHNDEDKKLWYEMIKGNS